MLLRPRQKRQILDLSIQIDKNNIEGVKETVFSGVTHDEHMSWEPHILSNYKKNIKINSNYLPVNFLPSQNLLTLFAL